MAKNLTTNQYWKLFERLPRKMKSVIVSEKTATNIFDICERNKVDINEISKVAGLIGQTMMGALPPNNLEQTIAKKFDLKKEQAQRLNQEIQEIIFSPIKEELENLYSAKFDMPTSKKSKPPKEHKASETSRKKTIKKDSYRELTE